MTFVSRPRRVSSRHTERKNTLEIDRRRMAGACGRRCARAFWLCHKHGKGGTFVMTDEPSPYPVRADLAAAQARVWDRLARAGTWLDGPTRIRIAAETRHAPDCALCAQCKVALSPYTIEGAHDGRGELPDNWIEMIHRIVADPGRLTHVWYRRMLASGIADTEYVEIVSVIAHVTAIDTFARGLGIPVRPLPAPLPGSRRGRRNAPRSEGPSEQFGLR